jgi:hypothetical protein
VSLGIFDPFSHHKTSLACSGIAIASLHCMPLTLQEISGLEQNLRQEIAAKQRLLGAYETFRIEMGSGGTFPPATLATSAPPPVGEPGQPITPPVAQPPRYINPELEEWKRHHLGNGGLVRWAIQRMTRDYCGRDLAELLREEGEYLTPAEVSVVLTRLKKRGEIQEIRPGTGRTGAIFRRPDYPLPVRKDAPIETDNADETAQPIEVS